VREWELVGCAPADAWDGWEPGGRPPIDPRRLLDASLFAARV
jgi:hypothetical protein